MRTSFKKRSIWRVVFIVTMAVASLSLASCTDTFTEGDNYVCVLNTHSGEITKKIPPGETEGYDSGQDEVAYKVPTSNRFYNVTTDRAKADDGAPGWLNGYSNDYKQLRVIETVRFTFFQPNICKFVLKHIKRNDPDTTGDFEFNARLKKDGNPIFTDGDRAGVAKRRAKTKWAVWLNENMAVAMEATGKPLWQSKAWPYLVFNYPVNANSNGELAETEKPGNLTLSELEVAHGEAISNYLEQKLGGKFFCGISYDPDKDADLCPPIVTEITEVRLTDESPIKARDELAKQRDERDNALAEKNLAQQTLGAKQGSQEAKSQLAELDKAEANREAEVAKSQQAAKLQQKLAEVPISPEVAECLVLFQATGTCPLIEQSKNLRGDQTTINLGGSGGAKAGG